MPDSQPQLALYDLAAPRFSASAINWRDAFIKAQPLAPPGVHYDGDFQTATPTGFPTPSHPFAAVGDVNAAIIRQPMMQDGRYFQPLALGTPNTTDNRLLLIDEVNFKDLGGRIMTWERLYAPVPQPQDVWGSMSYGFQLVTGISQSLTLQEKPFTVSTRIRTEYFHVSQHAAYPPLLALRAMQLDDSKLTLITRRGTGDLSLRGIYVVSTDLEIVAEDSKIDYWHYPIMYRRTPWIQGPSLAFWGNNTALPILPALT